MAWLVGPSLRLRSPHGPAHVRARLAARADGAGDARCVVRTVGPLVRARRRGPRRLLHAPRPVFRGVLRAVPGGSELVGRYTLPLPGALPPLAIVVFGLWLAGAIWAGEAAIGRPGGGALMAVIALVLYVPAWFVAFLWLRLPWVFLGEDRPLLEARLRQALTA